MSHPHALTIAQVTKLFATKPSQGLTPTERAHRLTQYGPNALPEPEGSSLLDSLKEQFSNPIVLLLLATATVSAVTGSWLEAGLVYGIVVVMAGIGIFLEKQSEKSLEQLKSLQTPFTTVLSQGKAIEVSSDTLVPGDIILLQEGDLIAADARVIEADEVLSDEAALTGESLPVSKQTAPVAKTAPLGDQKSLLFAGTVVVQGSARAIVVKTGVETEVGKIATYLNQAEQELTPLQKELEKVGRFLLIITMVSVAIILAVYLYRGKPLIESLLVTTSLAIAFIPEGLSAVMTTALALAVAEMVRKKVIVKKLLAAEGLGSVTHVATDKTGTVTEGVMRVCKVVVNNTLFDVADPKLKKQAGYKELIDVIRFCNNNKGPTEQALVAFIESHGFSYELEGRKVEHRFTSDAKRMSVIRQHQGNLHLFSKGAPDILIPLCDTEMKRTVSSFTEREKTAMLKKAEELAGQGFRVLALAERTPTPPGAIKNRDLGESSLCFVGLIALMDPLRPTVKETVAGFHRAGIVPIMITGDHPAIARYIAEQAGIITRRSKAQVLTGTELDQILTKTALSDNRAKLQAARVFARVRPEHKVLLVDFYQQQGYQVAMAGDGINDAAALKKANIGIAMNNGTGLTKDIADVVITGMYDALLKAVSVGRTVKLRTQLYLHYLLSGNTCQVGLFFLAVLFDWPVPLTAVMILMINLLTDALPAMAMAVEPEDPELIAKKINELHPSILSPQILRGIAIQGVISTLALAGVFYWLLPQGLVIAQTGTFTLYIFQKALRGLTARSFTRSVLEYGWLSNWLMNWALVSVVVAWFVLVKVIPHWVGMANLQWQLIGVLLAVSLIMPLAEEVTKKSYVITRTP
ncbi:MAG TPA: cation-transporting P-type ATPase [Vitreimonas sp.]|nr:cation-transporting P-type ATPase [Vitreimonas sp.]